MKTQRGVCCTTRALRGYHYSALPYPSGVLCYGQKNTPRPQDP
jgi:hypothetical protein